MIDLKNRIVFIHIPKTGGSSIERYFLKIRGLDDVDSAALGVFKNRKSSNLERGNQHNSLAMYEKYYFGGPIPDDFRIFTVVRNPYNRFWSEWKSRKLPPPMRFPVSFYLSAEQLIFLAEKRFSILKDFNSHIHPQTSFIEGQSEDRVRIIRFENLNEDFSHMISDWELPSEELPHSNEAKRTGVPSAKEQDVGDNFVRRFYESDFSKFNYLR